MPVARSDIPVNRADIVSDLIFPDLGKLHAPALVYGMIFSGKHIVDETACGDFNPSNFFKYLFWDHNNKI